MHRLRSSSHFFISHSSSYVFWQLFLESSKVDKIALLLDSKSHVTSNILQLRVCQLKPINISLVCFEFRVLEIIKGLVNNIFC